MPNIFEKIKKEATRVEERAHREVIRIVYQAKAVVEEKKLEREVKRIVNQVDSLVQGAASTAVQTEPALLTSGPSAPTAQSPGDTIPQLPDHQ